MSNSLSRPIIVIGAGGHAKVVIHALRDIGAEVIAAVDTDARLHGTEIAGVPVIGGDEAIESHPPGTVHLVNGVGSVSTPEIRRAVFVRLVAQGYEFAGLIHPSAVIASDVKPGQGSQIMAGAVVQPGTLIGANSIINTRASVDHDCRIGDHVHIAPGATLSGEVTVGEGSHIGTGASVIQGIFIGDRSVVGAGAAVIGDVPDGVTVTGVPAREITRKAK
jgi:UDP-perosamine 4-acetyltransferase